MIKEQSLLSPSWYVQFRATYYRSECVLGNSSCTGTPDSVWNCPQAGMDDVCNLTVSVKACLTTLF